MRKQDIRDKYHRRRKRKHSETELMVNLTPDAARAIRALGFSVGEKLPHTSYTVVTVPGGMALEPAVSALIDTPGVSDVEINEIFDAVPTEPTDPHWPDQKALLGQMDMGGWWDLIDGYKGAIHQSVIASLDSGFDVNHPDMAGQFILPGYNSYYGTDAVSEPEVNGINSHGTLTALNMIAIRNNGVGTTGLALGGKVYPIRLTADNDGSSDIALVRAIDRAAEMGIRVLSMSFYGSRSAPMTEAVAFARSHGALIFASAGNTSQMVNELCFVPGVLGVSGLDNNSTAVSPYSVYGEGTAFCTPYRVYVYDRMSSGTSHSCPVASSLAASMLAIDPTLTADDVIRIMAEHCVPETPPSGSARYGYGVPQFTKTLAAVIENAGVSGIWGPLGEIKRMNFGGLNIAAAHLTGSAARAKKIWNPIAERDVAAEITAITGQWPAALQDALASAGDLPNEIIAVTGVF